VTLSAGDGELSAHEIFGACLDELSRVDEGAYYQFAGTARGAIPEFPHIASSGSVRGEDKDDRPIMSATTRRDFDE